MNEKFEIGNIKVALRPWEKYGKKRIYLACCKRDGSKLPGKGYDGGYFDATGYHRGKGGWIENNRYHYPQQWDQIEAKAKEMLK